MNNGKRLDNSNILNTPKNRFYFYINIPNKNDDCIIWAGGKDSCGYGVLRTSNRKKEKAHRFSYFLHYGEIPENKCVCHKCDNPSCVNPDHLFLASHKENMKDRDNKKRGHQFKENSHFAKGKAFINKKTGRIYSNPKFNDEEILYIRKQLKLGRPQPELAKEFNVTNSVISRINTKVNYKYIDGDI